MLFNSLTFLVFLAIVFFLYWFVTHRNLRLQNLLIVVVSYIFYGWWDWRFLFLIFLSSIIAWGLGILCESQRHKGSDEVWRKGCVAASCVINLGILGFFKYFNFFQAQAADLLHLMGFQPQVWALQILLPVGISFYTFQTLSYTIDVYRRHIAPVRDLIAFLAYVTYFPQLVAGPIERAPKLLPQFLNVRTFSYPDAVDGCRQMLWGFFKKMVVADNCSALANSILNGKLDNSTCGIAFWLGMFCFTVQIYCDFSGYSDIAIGCSRLFGIKLMRNFAYPYFSRDIGEFWRRWHISLSTWFRDYLYIPLGGSRGSSWVKIRNILVIFIVSGFWHGANWTFIAWGGLHALYFMPLLLLGWNRRYTDVPAQSRIFPSFNEGLQITTTFLLVVCAWVFFRAPDLSAAFFWLKQMFTLAGGFQLNGIGLTAFCKVLPWILLLFGVEWVNRTYQHGLGRMFGQKCLRWGVYVGLSLVIWVARGGQQAFIYFQF